MGIRMLLARLTGRAERRYSLAEAAQLLQRIPLSGMSSAGISVTENNALTFAAVYACVRVLAESVSALPLILYRRLPDGGRERATDHPLYGLLHDAPNPMMTSLELRETMQGHLALRGNAYAYIERAGGSVTAIWPLRPDRMEIKRSGGSYLYLYRPASGGTVVYQPDEILHLKGLSPDGLVGYSPIKLAREAIGVGLAAQQYGAKLYANDARPGGILKTDQNLDEEAFQRLKRQWEAAHQGSGNAWRVAVLENGLEWQSVGMAPDDAQFLETRKFQVTEVARIFRIPPHMIGDLERATFSNIEQQSLEFVVHSLRPWLVRWEQAMAARLLTESERTTLYIEHLVDGLLRGDVKSRYEAYSTAIQWGIMSPNEVRERENLNPRPGGDVYLIPLNMVPSGERGEPGGPAPAALPPSGIRSADLAGPEGRRKLQRAYRRVLTREWERVVKRERNDVLAEARKRLAKRGVNDLVEWLKEFYAEHPTWTAEQVAAAYQSFAEAIGEAAASEAGADWEYDERLTKWVGSYLESAAASHSRGALAQLLEVISAAEAAGDDVLEALETRFDEWLGGGESGTTRPEKIAGRESVRFGQGFARAVWAGVGVGLLRWVASGENCPYCTELDGTIVGIDQHFVQAGGNVAPDGEKPLSPSTAIGHPPLHAGCDCAIVPVS